MCHLIRLRAIAFVLTSALAWAQESVTWHDPSKHSVQFVTVEDGVRLEVLDWGGTGRPVVLLAGYLTAHVYDITRRGYGASSHPESGYTAQRSADDVLQVLDSLRLTARPVLVGHSFGGQDLSTLGAEHSDRIAGLVYLNSARGPDAWPRRLWRGASGSQEIAGFDARRFAAEPPIV